MSMFDKLGDLLNEKLTSEGSGSAINSKESPLGGQFLAADATIPEKTQTHTIGDVADAALFFHAENNITAQIYHHNEYNEDEPVKIIKKM